MNYPESSEDRKQINNVDSAQKHDGGELRSTVVVSPQTNTTAETESDVSREQPEPKPPKKKPTNWLAIGAIALLVGGGFFGWRWWQTNNTQGQSPPGQSQMRAIPVNISTVGSSTIEESSEFVANLESRQSVTLLPQIQGRVSQIYVGPGDEVKAGTPLVQIDPDEQQAAVGSAEAAVAAAQAQVAQARASLRSLEAQRLSNQSQLQLNQRQYERYSSLAQ
jgi:multidrug efflux pump subunit AcrA (membrane-fusion protein)